MRRRFTTCWGQICSACGTVKAFAEFHAQQGKANNLRAHCKDCRNKQYSKQYATDAGRRLAQTISWRSQGIKGMSVERYEAMLAEQSGGCAICGATEEANGRRLCVDHDHSSGEVRALLCDSCNVGLGRFNDNPKLVRRALNYLEAHAMKAVV